MQLVVLQEYAVDKSHTNGGRGCLIGQLPTSILQAVIEAVMGGVGRAGKRIGEGF